MSMLHYAVGGFFVPSGGSFVSDSFRRYFPVFFTIISYPVIDTQWRR